MRDAGQYHGMVVRSRTRITKEVIDAGANLKILVRGGVGLDNIEVKYAESKGIAVRNTPKASADSVAELTIGYLLSLARKIPQASASMAAGEWKKKELEGIGDRRQDAGPDRLWQHRPGGGQAGRGPGHEGALLAADPGRRCAMPSR